MRSGILSVLLLDICNAIATTSKKKNFKGFPYFYFTIYDPFHFISGSVELEATAHMFPWCQEPKVQPKPL